MAIGVNRHSLGAYDGPLRLSAMGGLRTQAVSLYRPSVDRLIGSRAMAQYGFQAPSSGGLATLTLSVTIHGAIPW